PSPYAAAMNVRLPIPNQRNPNQARRPRTSALMPASAVATVPLIRQSALHKRSSLFREPGVHGAILTEALASRFKVHIHIPTDWDLARRLGVPQAAVDAAIALNQH